MSRTNQVAEPFIWEILKRFTSTRDLAKQFTFNSTLQNTLLESKLHESQSRQVIYQASSPYLAFRIPQITIRNCHWIGENKFLLHQVAGIHLASFFLCRPEGCLSSVDLRGRT